MSAQSSHSAPAPTSHPPAFWFIFWGEFAERCSYYGMRAILPLYLTSTLAFPDATAGPIYYWFKMAVYFLPLLGGYLADRFLGKYWTIVGFSVPYVLGHFVLGIESRVALFFALCLLAAGSGVIKPNIPTLMGLTYDQDRPGQERLLSSAFRWFYLAVNIGALISQFLMPILRNHYGYRLAFQFPAWLMVAALIAFASGKRHYAVETPGSAVTNPDQHRQQWQTLGTLFGFFGLMVFFWFGYEHNDSLWVFFARDYVDRTIPWLDTVVAADQIQFLNSLFVIIFVPTLTAFFRFADRDQRLFTPANRILIGFFITAAAIGLVSAAGFAAQGGMRIPLVWIAAAYIALTLGEVLVYATGLELSYTAAPKNMKGFISACFFVTSTLGNFINVWYSRLYGGSLSNPPEERGPLLPGPFFGLTALVVLIAAVASYYVGRQLTRAIEQRSPFPQGRASGRV